MEPSAILSLLKDGGPWAMAVMGWYLFFQRDKRVTTLEDERVALIREVLQVTQRISDVNHVALAVATAKESTNG